MKLRCSYIFILIGILAICNYSFSQAQVAKTIVDTAIIKNLEKKTKDIYNNDPQLGIVLIDSLCKIYKANNLTEDYYQSRIKLGHCYNVLQHHYKAIGIYEDCANYFKERNDSLYLMHVYSGIGNVNFGLKNYAKAKEYFALALNICSEKKYPHHKVLAYSNLANCYMEYKKYDTVLVLYNNAKQLLKYIVGKPDYAYRLKTNYAYLYAKTNQYNRALTEAFDALNYYKVKAGDVIQVMRLYELIGISYTGLKQYNFAKLYIDTANNMNKQYNSMYNSYDMLEDYMRIDTGTRNYQAAVNKLLQMITIKDSLYAADQLNLTNDLLYKYESEKKDNENKILEAENKARAETIQRQKALLILVILLAIGIIAILFFYLRYRNEQNKKRIEQEKIATELKALKAQLNPHFIQNIFQIIANQVNVNPSHVSEFLQKTANYFRSVLHGTDKNVQSLEDEILFTEKYLQFQQSLFSNKLTYSVDVDDNVDTIGIMVPTMLMQPFVENSIKYGLQQTQQDTHISIKVFNNKKYLQIEIIDNGENAANATSVNQKSFGNALISKRLHLFYKNYKEQPSLVFTYLENNGGYKVSISLPTQLQ